MSEQMSVEKMLDAICSASGYILGTKSKLLIGALILADRKATVDRYILVLYDTMKKHGVAVDAPMIICVEKALDAVLEDKHE